MVFVFLFLTCCLAAKSCPTLLQPYGLQPTRLLCPWDLPGKNTGMSHHSLFQGIFPTQESNQCLLHCSWATREALPSDLLHSVFLTKHAVPKHINGAFFQCNDLFTILVELPLLHVFGGIPLWKFPLGKYTGQPMPLLCGSEYTGL